MIFFLRIIKEIIHNKLKIIMFNEANYQKLLIDD